ncbi:hypothetical protein GMORB2_2213 [Geosmithia morbida]|uniref:TM7S3/TM198-like domain-containing protein n=1 Tax=Geosmithia morbida TaxID=1094350 RepID=A0A9P4YQG7_9HYPO|nr:uncharacterized protein GMORB2_2213 [Geosmithia morbida]KAF4121251.1 hypothetical protein GMORB2_2213 [Geosmithia morbida]
MLLSFAQLRLLLCLTLVWQLVAAKHINLVARQEDTVKTADARSSSGNAQETSKVTATGTASDNDKTQTAVRTASYTDNPTKTSTEEPESTSSVVISTDGPLDNSTLTNGMTLSSSRSEDDGLTANITKTVVIPPDQLPLKPRITPGWGVAGAILLVSGGAYTFIGIRNRTVHTFFSTACATALGIAVLIVYVMNVPVKLSVQGGYVAAVVLSGCALGTASIFLKELTECLSCALGGFCLSMWLLCLSPGGLLHTVFTKAIFIACFTVGSLAFYFNHYTRDWALILTISFSGATAVVLGIDCFSRAGLKEFWAYVWHLNDDLFPLGTETYPVTKGIRAEEAAIIIITLVGIISQIRLWKVVREKRAERAAERARGQRDLEEEESNIGRQVEDANVRDRKEWERVYGDGEQQSSDADSQFASSEGVGSSGEKIGDRHLCANNVDDGGREDGAVEICDMSGSDRVVTTVDPLTKKDQDGKVIVRIAQDDLPADAADNREMETHCPDSDPDATDETQSPDTPALSELPINAGAAAENEKCSSVPDAPAVVPLPFAVPYSQDDGDSESKGDRSSVATFATDDDVRDPTHIPTRQGSFAKRLSHGSIGILRNLSQRSNGGHNSSSFQRGESSEELIMAGVAVEEVEDGNDARSSLAATFDDLSDADIASIASSRHTSVNSQQGGDVEAFENNTTAKDETAPPLSTQSQVAVEPTNLQAAAEASTETVEKEADGAYAGEHGNEKQGYVDAGQTPAKDPSDKTKSNSSGLSTPTSLTKGHLPSSLSRVALSYRTNEWAKHLSYADAPEPDDVDVSHAVEMSPTLKSTRRQERAAPLDVDDLQRGAGNGGVPPISILRSDSQTSVLSTTERRSQRKSPTSPTFHKLPVTANADREQALAALSGHPVPASSSRVMSRTPSASNFRRASLTFDPSSQQREARGPATIPEDDERSQISAAPQRQASGDEDFPRQSIPGIVSFSSPQTLIAQRETFLRNKSHGSLLASPPPRPESRMREASGELGGEYSNRIPYASGALGSDADDIPLSQRRQMMQRNSSMPSVAQQPQQQRRRSSTHHPVSGYDFYNNKNSSYEDPATSSSPQPGRRNSSVISPAAREARLSQFRSSVAMDLRSGTPIVPNSGRETPFGSTPNLLAGNGQQDVQRTIQAQRSMLMSKKEAEIQRKEAKLREKQWAEQVFDERMRSGELLDAHRQAIRRMQQSANRE